VLRKKPPGKLLRGAHAIDREYHIQKVLYGQNYPVPEPIHYCTQVDVIGTEFYIMKFVEGRIFTDQSLPGLSPEERELVYEQMASCLAKLHKFNPADIGLGDYSKAKGNYYARGIKTWSKNFKLAETETIKDMEYLIEWLPKNIP